MTTSTSGVFIVYLHSGHWNSNGRWFPANLLANVDSFIVRCKGNGKGWTCSCSDPECQHLERAAALLASSALDRLEADNDERFRPPNPALNRTGFQSVPDTTGRIRRKRTVTS